MSKSLEEIEAMYDRLGRISDLVVLEFSERDDDPTEIVEHIRRSRQTLESGINRLQARVRPANVGQWIEGRVS